MKNQTTPKCTPQPNHRETMDAATGKIAGRKMAPEPNTDTQRPLSNHQLRNAIMLTVNALRQAPDYGTLPPETTKLLNEHLTELQLLERRRASPLFMLL